MKEIYIRMKRTFSCLVIFHVRSLFFPSGKLFGQGHFGNVTHQFSYVRFFPTTWGKFVLDFTPQGLCRSQTTCISKLEKSLTKKSPFRPSWQSVSSNWCRQQCRHFFLSPSFSWNKKKNRWRCEQRIRDHWVLTAWIRFNRSLSIQVEMDCCFCCCFFVL